MLPKTRLALLGLAALVASCNSAFPVDASSAAASANLEAHVVALIGDAACDNSHQCRTVGVGAKPCGGPEGYLPWSTKVTDARALQEAVQAQAQARAEENKRSGMASDCMMRPEPMATCRPRARDGKSSCQLGQGGVDSAV